MAKVPDSANIAIETARPGRKTISSSTAQVHTAIGPIQRSRVSGPMVRVKTGAASTAPACPEAMTSPAAAGPPPSRAAYGAAMPSGMEYSAISQPSIISVRIARSPSTSLAPWPSPSRAPGRPSPVPAAAGLALVPNRTSAADATNVAASMPSAGRVPMKATVTPAAAAPATSATRKLVCMTAAASAYRSPSNRSGRIADLAASNGACAIVVAYSRPTSPATGIPGNSITVTSTARIRSQATITSRRGNRSPRPESTGPPIIQGT
jgi:hypothetical protein